MKKYQNIFRGLGPFMTLWSTQAVSALGSSMTSFALIIWSYQQQGSALTTALLSVCSYAPYVLLSIFAGVSIRESNTNMVQKDKSQPVLCRKPR